MCDILHEEKLLDITPEYHDCMKNVYDQNYGENSLQFCQLIFGNSSKVYSEENKKDKDFGQDMLECY